MFKSGLLEHIHYLFLKAKRKWEALFLQFCEAGDLLLFGV